MKAEDNVISYLLYGSDVDYEGIIEDLKEDYFTKEKYCLVYRTIKQLLEDNEVITPNTIFLNLKASDYFTLTDLCITSAELKPSLKKLKVEYLKRVVKERMKIVSDSIDENSTQTDLDACITELQNELNNIQIGEEYQGVNSIKDIATNYLCNLEDIKSGKKELGLKTGIRTLDDYLYGELTGNSIIVIGARPSIGKSALALQIILNLLRERKKVLYVNLEMNENQIMNRLVSNSTGIPLYKLKTAVELTDDEYKKIGNSVNGISNSGLYIDFDIDINSEEIFRYAMQLKKRGGLDAIFIDHLQLLARNENGYSEGNTKRAVDNAMRNIKRIAKILDIPVFVLSQLNRDKNGNNEAEMIIPSMDKLKESGDIEQDANIVIMLNRIVKDSNGWTAPLEQQEELFFGIEKNRDSKKGSGTLYYKLDTQTITDKVINI